MAKILKQDNQQEKLLPQNQKKKESVYRAAIRTNGIGNAVYSMNAVFKNENLDLEALAENLAIQQKNMSKGKTTEIELILFGQAHTLQALFHYSAAKISNSETLAQLQTYTDLAIKANNACRKTLLAINQIKNPPKATFIKQQHNTAVNQQINQGQPEALPAQSLEISETKQKNELLSEVTHEKLDSRVKSPTSKSYPQVETLVKSGS